MGEGRGLMEQKINKDYISQFMSHIILVSSCVNTKIVLQICQNILKKEKHQSFET